MKYITTTGAYGTGSSAVIDLLREYSCIAQPSDSDFEIMFFFDYNGIPNLRYWFTKGHRCQQDAIDDFLHEAEVVASFGTKMNYEKYFGGRFLHETKKYIGYLQGKAMGEHYVNDFFKMSNFEIFTYRVINKVYNVIANSIYNLTHTDVMQKSVHLFGSVKQRHVVNMTDDEFVRITKNYLESLFKPLSQGKNVMLLDGFVGTDCIDDISVYFDEFATVVVERDPRDVFLSSKYIWKTGTVPSEVENFCRWYKARVQSVNYVSSDVIKIKFEDLIYKYDETKSLLESFLGIDKESHILKERYFVPTRSMQNTRLWEKYPNESDNMDYIKKNLCEYLYVY